MPSLIISIVLCILLYIFQTECMSSNTISISLSNIPSHLHKLSTYHEILTHLANSSTPLCRGSVLYNPQTSIYYFRNPSKNSQRDINSYFKMKCRKIPYYFHNKSQIQIFKLEYSDIKQIVSNNDNSIFRLGLQEVSDVKLGFEMSLFPVKFYKTEKEYNNDNKNFSFLCYDSFKVLGLDNKNNDYFILSAKNIYEIVYCNSYDINANGNYINNYFRFSSYCDELCHEDFIFLSKDLIRCQCDFEKFVSHKTVGKYNLYKIASNTINSLDITNNQIDIKDIKDNNDSIIMNNNYYSHLSKSDFVYLRMFNSNGLIYNVLVIVFAFQLLYMYLIYSNKKYIFMKISIFFYFCFFIMFYSFTQICLIINFTIFSYETFYIITKLYFILCPIAIIIKGAITGNYEKVNIIALNLILSSIINILDNCFNSNLIFNIIYKGTFFLILHIHNTNNNEYSLNAYLIINKMKLMIQLMQEVFLYNIQLDLFRNMNYFFYTIITIRNDDLVLGNSTLFIKLNVNNVNGRCGFIIWIILRYLIMVCLGEAVVNGFSYVKEIISCLWVCDIKKLLMEFMNMGMELIVDNKKFRNVRSKMVFMLIFINQIFIVRECCYLLLIHIIIGFFAKMFNMNYNDNTKLNSFKRISNSTDNLRRIILDENLNNENNVLQLDDVG